VIGELKPYADYKDSGLPWLGQVPAHWEVRRIKTVLREIDRRSSTGRETLLSLRMQAGLVDHHALGGKPIPPSALVGYKRVLPGEIVMNRMRASAGLFAAATSDGLVSPDYAIFRLVDRVNVAYAVRLFRTPAMSAVFRLESTGLGTGESGFLRLYSDQFGRLAIPTPAIGEQVAIVLLLEWANGRVERAIRAKRRVIALLMEQRQAVIHRAITRGLDPNAALNPSGVSWLGDIPQHWEVWRISRFARVGNGSTPSRSKPSYWDGGMYPWLNSSQVNRPFIDSADQFVTKAALRECHLPRVPAGSLLVAITGQGKTRGMSAILGVEATINQHIAYITPRIPIASAEFIHLALTGAYHQLRAASEDAGSTKGAITCEDLKRFKIAIPPAAEQAQLVRHIKSVTGDLAVAAARLEREIELLLEFRTRLTADVVTGKLDVREAATRLPEEAAVETADDFIDDTDDSELVDEEATEA
jgi:type I restriction enzyme S subunit